MKRTGVQIDVKRSLAISKDILALLVMLLVGCSAGLDEGVGSVASQLARAGAVVRVVEETVPSLASIGEQAEWRLCVNEQLVSVFVFPDPTTALDVARGLDVHAPPRIGRPSIAWRGDARFWQFGQLVVAYFGRVDTVEQTLTAALGPVASRGGGRAADPATFKC